ncbi:MAG: rod shape-determining protein MreC [Clostridia bacterium]|nr:rod shape-determining protein MreC [Clostridia bacterium]
MNSFFKKKATKILGAILGALILGAIIAGIAHSGSTPLSSVAVTIMKPFQQVSTFIGSGVDYFCDFFRSSDTLQKENAKLKQQIADYQGELADYENTKRTLKTYEEFLGVKEEHPDFEFISASILSRDTGDAFGSIILSKGSSKGVQVNDPVIYGKNLVGVVTDVNATSCTVTTFSSPKFNAAVYEVRSNVMGYATGFEDGAGKKYCKLPGLDKDCNLATGGVICTLGIGGVFPKDLIVGTVSEINKSKSDISYYAKVESNVDLAEIKDVFIITDFNGQGIDQ